MAKKVKPKTEASTEVPPRKEGPLFSHIEAHLEQIDVLRDAIAKHRLAGTLLFVGPSGIGKKLVAFGVAQALVCEKRVEGEGQACGVCGQCIRVASGQNENVFYVEAQGAGIKIEQAQEILQFIAFRKLGRARVVIINDAHLLNPQAGNSLLKSLEEPPPETHFILVTSHPGAILTTIRSRSQTIRFQTLPDEVLRKLYPRVPDWLIRSAQGSLEAIQRLQENATEWESARRLALTQLEFLLKGQVIDSDEFREVLRERTSALFVTQTWQRALRDFTVAAALNGDVEDTRLLLPDQMELTQTAKKIPQAWLLQLEELCLELEQDINRNIDRTLAFENFALAFRKASSGRAPKPVL